MIRALFICKKRLSYGNSYGLLNSASFIVEYLNNIGLKSKIDSAIDGNQVDCIITKYNPLFVFIEALWITPEKLKEIMSLPRHRNRVFIIRLHSRPTFIANEGIAFKWLLGYRKLNFKNLIIAPNNEEFAVDLKEVFDLQSVYLPNIYNPPEYNTDDIQKNSDDSVIRIGCFGSIRPMKNHLTQAIAAVKFAQILDKKLDFHVNATRMEQQGDQVLDNLRYFFNGLNVNYQLIEHDWLSHEDFIRLILQLDIGMQISLTETFNIIAADFVNNNIPFIGSKQIAWLPCRFQVKDPNSTNEIVEKLEYSWSIMGSIFRSSSIKSLNKYNRISKKVWNNFIL